MAYKTFGIILLALLAPFLYERGQTLAIFYRNAPGRMVKIDTFKSHEVKFADRIRSCEDVLLVEDEGLALLACDPGREKWNTVMGVFLPDPVSSGNLYVYNYKDTSASDDDDDDTLKKLEFIDFEHEADFHSLGMTYNETSSTLLVANHRHDSPAIEMFKIDLKAYTATHVRSIQHPLIHGPNSLIWINEHEFYVTNNNHFLARDHPLLSKLEIYLGIPLGTVVHVDIAQESPVANVVTRVPFANGIELLNSTAAVVASSSKAKLYFFNIDTTTTTTTTSQSPPVFKHAFQVSVGFMPDNLSLSKDGGLMISGHPHMPTLVKFTQTRFVCNSPEELSKADEATKEACRTLTAPSWAARWTQEGGVENLYADDEYPSSATAVRDSDRRMGIISGLYAKGIFVWKE
ncbi:putative paraoxonase [Poronia punctata]|nr:putative paraoxonase [Poronia punctata]